MISALKQTISSDMKLLCQSGELKLASEILNGKEIGLYFAGNWCPMCRNFSPSLSEFLSKTKRNIQIILVPSDLEPDSFQTHLRSLHGSIYSLQYGDPLVDELKIKHRVWSGREVPKFGPDRRAGIPSIVLIDGKEDEILFLETEKYGTSELQRWDSLAESTTWTFN
eukprot:gene7632-15620_t